MKNTDSNKENLGQERIVEMRSYREEGQEETGPCLNIDGDRKPQ